MVGIVWGWTGGLHSRRRSCRTDCHGGVEPASGGEVTVACVAFLKDRPASTNRSASLTRSGQSADDPPRCPFWKRLPFRHPFLAQPDDAGPNSRRTIEVLGPP